MRFQVNDIVQSAPGWAKGIFVITELHPERPSNQYNGMNLVTSKGYKLSEESLAEKRIGIADQNALDVQENKPTDNLMYENGKIRAVSEARFANGIAKARWEKLASLKSDEQFYIGAGETVRFRHVLANGQRYVFSASNRNGKIYKYPLEVIKVDVAKRTEKEILDDICNAYCGLSPENLSCDGMLSRSRTIKKERELRIQLQALQLELGRNVNEDEAFAIMTQERAIARELSRGQA